jgi:hypothetical protein
MPLPVTEASGSVTWPASTARLKATHTPLGPSKATVLRIKRHLVGIVAALAGFDLPDICGTQAHSTGPAALCLAARPHVPGRSGADRPLTPGVALPSIVPPVQAAVVQGGMYAAQRLGAAPHSCSKRASRPQFQR